MSDRVKFEITCPNNHNQTVSFDQEEFEHSLKDGTFEFHCNTCDTNWTPSSDDIAAVRKQFANRSA